MKNSSSVAHEAIITVTMVILLVSIMQWLSKSLTATELFTGEQIMFIILGASSSPFLWHIMRKVTPYVIKRIATEETGVELKTITKPTEGSIVEPESETQMSSEKSNGELQTELLDQVEPVTEAPEGSPESKSPELNMDYGHEVEREEEPALDMRLKISPTAQEPVEQEPQQSNEDYNLNFTEEELKEIRDLTKTLRELKRRLLTYT